MGGRRRKKTAYDRGPAGPKPLEEKKRSGQGEGFHPPGRNALGPLGILKRELLQTPGPPATDRGRGSSLGPSSVFHQIDLAPRLRELPRQTPLLFFSDHGFVENPHFDKTDKYRTSRYSHGEASPFKVIVPWAAAVRM
jgi:hypothetical protein